LHRDFVEQPKWNFDTTYKEGLAAAHLARGQKWLLFDDFSYGGK